MKSRMKFFYKNIRTQYTKISLLGPSSETICRNGNIAYPEKETSF